MHEGKQLAGLLVESKALKLSKNLNKFIYLGL